MSKGVVYSIEETGTMTKHNSNLISRLIARSNMIYDLKFKVRRKGDGCLTEHTILDREDMVYGEERKQMDDI